MKTYRINMPGDRDVKYKMFVYPAGEKQVRLNPEEFTKIGKADIIEVTADIKDGEVMELALLTSALKGVCCPNIHTRLVLPYLPYGRADRRFLNGDCHGLWTFATIINHLGYSCVDTYDVHSDAAKKLIPNLVNIPPDTFIEKVIKDVGKKGLTVLLPDKGATRYISILKTLGVPFLFASKTRDQVTGELTGFIAPDGLNRKVLVVDDICDGGRTFIGLASAVIARAHNEEYAYDPTLFLYVTHGIFSKGTSELRIYFKEIYTTETFKSVVNVKRVI